MAKLPDLTSKTKFLCFDLETNGLHGQAFAIGALIIDRQGKVHDEFTARVKITGEIDEWVTANVLPSLEGMQITHGSYEAMREAFWRWFVAAQEKSDYVLVSNGYPVEYRFLLDCQEADLDERYWQHPFPLLDSTSVLFGCGIVRSEQKKELQKTIATSKQFRQHNPVDDAYMTALLTIAALQRAGQTTD